MGSLVLPDGKKFRVHDVPGEAGNRLLFEFRDVQDLNPNVTKLGRFLKECISTSRKAFDKIWPGRERPVSYLSHRCKTTALPEGIVIGVGTEILIEWPFFLASRIQSCIERRGGGGGCRGDARDLACASLAHLIDGIIAATTLPRFKHRLQVR